MQQRIKKQSQKDASNEPLEPLLSIPDVMALLQISRPTVYTLFAEGLPYVKFGKSVRIFPSSLQRFLAQREQVA